MLKRELQQNAQIFFKFVVLAMEGRACESACADPNPPINLLTEFNILMPLGEEMVQVSGCSIEGFDLDPKVL